jgi:multiple sugar transport system ATP-binding protein
MNFLPFRGSLAPGGEEIRLGEGTVRVPASREAIAESELVLGVRPEHVRFAEGGAVKGGIYGTEYLGTTQIVTVETAFGMVRARASSSLPLETGENVSLAFRPERLSIFEKSSGRAIRTALTEEVGHG